MKFTIKANGFTLLEVMVSSVIILTIGMAVVGMQYVLNKNQFDVLRNYVTVDESNNMVVNIIREIRNARMGENGGYALAITNDQEIIFYSDIDFDGKTEYIRYYLAGTQLYKSIIEPAGYPVSYPSGSAKTVLLTNNVRNGTKPLFYYFNGDWPKDTVHNPLAANRLSETKLVKIYLELNTIPDNPELNYVLDSYTQIRMLKENL